jgi:hypothetical protein
MYSIVPIAAGRNHTDTTIIGSVAGKAPLEFVKYDEPSKDLANGVL